MSNRRRKLRPRRAATPVSGFDWLPEKRPPWNKGLTLTKRPSMSTIGRQLQQMETAGFLERVPGRTGNRPQQWTITREMKRMIEITDILKRFGPDPRVLRPAQVDLLVSLGYVIRRDDGSLAFIEDYQAWWKYWNSKREAAEDRAARIDRIMDEELPRFAGALKRLGE